MKRSSLVSVVVIMLTLSTMLSSCQLVGDIFKAGVGVGVAMVVVVVGLVIFVLAKVFGGGSK